MEYTVTFTRYVIDTGKETLFETTICSEDPTIVKRETTKMAKTLEPFAKLQKERPLSWNTSGYWESENYSKRWTEYMRNSPITDDAIYNISISPTSSLLDTASRKVYDAGDQLKKAIEELQKNHSFNPNLSKIDPGLPEILDVKLPDHLSALVEIFETVKTRINERINELNSKVD